MPTIQEADILYQSFSELPKSKRYRVMILLPFLDDPVAKVMLVRQLCRDRKAYRILFGHPNAAEIIHDLFDKSLRWLQDKPTGFTFPFFSWGGYRFDLPDDRFSDTTFGTLVELDSLFTRYLRSQKESIMDAFLKELYTVIKTGPAPIDQVLADIPYPYRLDAFRMYAVVREKIFTKFPHLFSGSPSRSLSEVEGKGTSKKTPKTPLNFKKIQDSTPLWHSVLFSLAETPAYQGMKTAKEANMWEALTYLDEKAFQAAKEREKHENSIHT
jgi:hypothetical protein